MLNEIALTTDRSRALAYAEQARLALVEWPRDHYGYRQQDVREIVSLLDESISDLRAALGITSFDLALVASPAEVALEPLQGMPGAARAARPGVPRRRAGGPAVGARGAAAVRRAC